MASEMLGIGMRRVEIVEDQSQVYSWAAIDQRTRQRLLQLRDPDQLRSVCERLEWQVVNIKLAGPDR
jgi:hypothetical protein